jgi:hypothetical protein
MPIEMRDLALEALRIGVVVAIERGDELAACAVEPAVARRRDSRPRRLADEPHARIGLAPDDRRRLVGRPVVDDDQLEITEALRENAVDRGLQVAGPVVRGDDDADASRRNFEVFRVRRCGNRARAGAAPKAV